MYFLSDDSVSYFIALNKIHCLKSLKSVFLL